MTMARGRPYSLAYFQIFSVCTCTPATASTTTTAARCSATTAEGTVKKTQAEPRSTPNPRWMSHQPTYIGCRLNAYGPVVTRVCGRSRSNPPAAWRRRSDNAQPVNAHPAAISAWPAAR